MSNLTFTADLGVPSLNGIALGARFDELEFLGRSDVGNHLTFGYSDLGISVDASEEGNFSGFTVAFQDDCNEFRNFQPYSGALIYSGTTLDSAELTLNPITDLFGDWYWLDKDEEETIAFFEFPNFELQVECSPQEQVKRFVLLSQPLMADAEQRESYGVDRPWPPTTEN